MGLLSNDNQRNRLVNFLINHNQKLCVVLYIVGLAWFLALAYRPLNAGTYFSENALLPGLVASELPTVLRSAEQLREEVRTEMKKDTTKTPRDWIFSKFQELGLEIYRQNFSVVYPFTSVSTRVVTGENIYAILRARRAASTEALLLSIPLRPEANKAKSATGGGVALALALAKEFKKKPYWSKDIIFLFSDYDEVGAMAWLDAYHQTESQYIITQDLEGRSGPLQAAINLELPLDNVHYYNLRLEGLNGQMPNLDLVNLMVKQCRREQTRVTIHHSKEEVKHRYSDSPHGDSFQDYKLALATMLKMMWYQASGAPSGNHGLFQKFHIESVTLQGVVKKKGTNDISTTARIIEGVFRSLNNLLERFHQSFFFYLLPSTNRYVSIGMYMPPFGLMALAGLIKGIALWVGADGGLAEEEKNKKEAEEKARKLLEGNKKDKEKESKQADESKSDEQSPPKEGEGDEETKESMKGKETESPSPNSEDVEDAFLDINPKKGVLTIIPIILVALLLAWMAHQGPELLTRIMPRFRIQMEDMVLYSMLAIFMAALMYPKLMTRKSNTPNCLMLDWRLLKSVALIAQTLALASVSLLNISQAFFLTAAMVPVTTLVRPTHRRISRWIQLGALFIISPLSLMFIVGLVSAWPQSTFLDLIIKAYTTSKELIFLGVMDGYLFNAWTESVITAVIFPIWLLFWAIPWVDP